MGIDALSRYDDPKYIILRLELQITLTIIYHLQDKYVKIVDELKEINTPESFLILILFKYTWDA